MGAKCSRCANDSSVVRGAPGNEKGAGDKPRELPASEGGREGDRTLDETRELEEFEPDFKRDVSTLVAGSFCATALKEYVFAYFHLPPCIPETNPQRHNVPLAGKTAKIKAAIAVSSGLNIKRQLSTTAVNWCGLHA